MHSTAGTWQSKEEAGEEVMQYLSFIFIFFIFYYP